MLLLEDKRFYVYVYLDPRRMGKYKYGEYEFDYEPFYVGNGCDKGYDKRYLMHLNEAKRPDKKKYKNPHKIRKIKKILLLGIDPIIIKLHEYITNQDVCMLEIKLIKIIGRQDLKTGSLTNLTDGGDGNTNWRPSKETIEKKQKI